MTVIERPEDDEFMEGARRGELPGVPDKPAGHPDARLMDGRWWIPLDQLQGAVDTVMALVRQRLEGPDVPGACVTLNMAGFEAELRQRFGGQ